MKVPNIALLSLLLPLDTGTEETSVEGLNLYESNWDALALLLHAGHVPNKSLHFGVYGGWQGEHNEPAWADRLDEVLDFLLPATDEFNPLLPRALGLSGGTIPSPSTPTKFLPFSAFRPSPPASTPATIPAPSPSSPPTPPTTPGPPPTTPLPTAAPLPKPASSSSAPAHGDRARIARFIAG